jgi:mono/diheme cytochrome c family protein
MHHGVIQHHLFVTTYLRKQMLERNLEKPLYQGRIYRLAHEGKALGPRPRLSQASIAELVQTLAHPNGWWRDTAQRLLIERQDSAAVPLLQSAIGHQQSAMPLARLHALWTLEGLNKLDLATLTKALDDPHAKIRAVALRLTETHLQGPDDRPECAALRAKVLSLAQDTNADVQIQLALTLGQIAPDENVKQLLTALSQRSSVALAREGALLSIASHEPAAPPVAVTSNGPPLSAEEQKRFELGKSVYEATCLACHQPHGLGQEGLAPPLVGSEWVQGSEERLIRIVLHGLHGPIHVKNQVFELDMPSLGVLDDDQIAGALTYIRREWGHSYAPVSAAPVKKIREATATREEAWSEAELLKIP